MMKETSHFKDDNEKTFGGRLRRLTKQQIFQIAVEAAKIYFNYNISAEEAIKKAKEMIENGENTSMDKVKEVN